MILFLNLLCTDFPIFWGKLGHVIGPLTPGAFCQKCINFWGDILEFFELDMSHIRSMQSTQKVTCNMTACLNSFPLASRFAKFLLGRAQKSKF